MPMCMCMLLLQFTSIEYATLTPTHILLFRLDNIRRKRQIASHESAKRTRGDVLGDRVTSDDDDSDDSCECSLQSLSSLTLLGLALAYLTLAILSSPSELTILARVVQALVDLEHLVRIVLPLVTFDCLFLLTDKL
jgi:hypothetical protein